jgi:endonuclease YncB( thermonuclease family)
VSKHWKPAGKATALGGSRIRRDPARPSRIRRDPIRLEKKVEAYSEEREIAVGVIGILLMAAVLVVVIVGIAVATIFTVDPAAVNADPKPFGQCYNSDGSNCVLSGDTIFVDHERVLIPGIEAPEINGARCQQEKDRGIAAAVGLSDLLQSGNVTVSPLFRDEYGRAVRKVAVKGQDVSEWMINHSLVRSYTGEKQKWCS